MCVTTITKRDSKVYRQSSASADAALQVRVGFRFHMTNSIVILSNCY
jgi:hypothetical protein